MEKNPKPKKVLFSKEALDHVWIIVLITLYIVSPLMIFGSFRSSE